MATIEPAEIEEMSEILAHMQLKDLVQYCSLKQLSLFPNLDVLTSEEEFLVYCISTMDNDANCLLAFEQYNCTKLMKAAVRDFVLVCLIRNGRLRAAGIQQLLNLWEPYIQRINSDMYESDIYQNATLKNVNDILCKPPLVNVDADAIAAKKTMSELDALVSFEKIYSVLTDGPMDGVEQYIADIKTNLRAYNVKEYKAKQTHAITKP